MTSFTAFSGAGIAAIQLGVVNINGAPMGLTGSLADDAHAPLKLLQFAKRFGGQVPQPVRTTVIGDNNRSRHEYIFNAPQMGELSFLFGSLDMDVYAGVTKTKKRTQGNGNSVLIQSNAPANAAQATVVVNIDSQIADTGSFGLKRFVNEIYPLVTVAPLLGNVQEVAGIEWGYYGVPTQAGKRPWGVPFSQDNDGATRAGGVIITSDYPLAIETFLAGAGSPTTFDLTYTPATPASTYIEAFKFADGSSVVVSLTPPKTLTFPALSAGDILVVKYEATDLLFNL